MLSDGVLTGMQTIEQPSTSTPRRRPSGRHSWTSRPTPTGIRSSPPRQGRRSGGRLRIHIQPPEGRGTGFKPTVTAAVPGEALEWPGHLGVRGLFDGRHEFRIDALEDGRSRLRQRETFSGLLVRLLLDGASIAAGFEATNSALETRVEGVPDASEPPVAA